MIADFIMRQSAGDDVYCVEPFCICINFDAYKEVVFGPLLRNICTVYQTAGIFLLRTIG